MKKLIYDATGIPAHRRMETDNVLVNLSAESGYSYLCALHPNSKPVLFDVPDEQGATSSALDVQVGGGHYKGKAIQPVTYIHANKLNFLEGCIVKRITRWRDKAGIEDLKKIKHEVDLLIELEGLTDN